MKRILLSSAAILAFTAVAQAADIPSKASVLTAAPVYDWTGFYIGANAGYARGTSWWTDTDYDWFGSTLDLHRDTGTFGAQIGYNQQVGRFVYGIEADLNWAGLSKDTNYNCFNSCSEFDVTIQDKWSWFGTVRGRAGIAADNVLVYLTGGLAVGHVTHTWTEHDDPPDSWSKFGGTKAGLAVGAGAEWGFAPQWTAKAEALYLDLGKSSGTNERGFEMEVRDSIFVARLGLNYRPGGKLAARGAPELAAPFNWTGFYVGANAGYAFGTAAWSDSDFAEHGGTLDLDKQSLIAGAQAGYNFQTGRLVYGVEADWNWVNLGRNVGTSCSAGVNCDNDTRNDWSWLATVRGRVGLAADNALAYVTAGPAFGDVKHAWLDANTPTDNHNEFGGTKVGIAFGGGIEWAIAQQWSTKVEYLYVDLGKSTDTNSEGFTMSVRDTAHIVRVGLNYQAGARMPVAPSAPFNWTGYYLGVNAGYGHGNSAWTDVYYDWYGGSLDNERDTFTGGLQVGLNQQTGRFVYGLEADINWANFGKDTNFCRNCGPELYDVRIENSWNWFATFRGRAGLAQDNVLIYVTGGLAVADVGHKWTEVNDVPDSWPTFGDTRVGAVVGGGVEWAIAPQWSAKAEGLYIDLGDASSTNPNGFTMHVRDTAYVARVGLNWRPR